MNLFEINGRGITLLCPYFPSAHFWLINKHSLKKIGQPTRDYRSCLIGIKCNEELIVPDFGFYLCLYLYQSGIWRAYGHGSINLVHLTVKDIRMVLNNSFILN